MDTITSRLHDFAAVTLDRDAQDHVVVRQRAFHRLGVLLPEAARAHQVREQNVTVPDGKPAIPAASPAPSLAQSGRPGTSVHAPTFRVP
jgi:hypothetical protein